MTIFMVAVFGYKVPGIFVLALMFVGAVAFIMPRQPRIQADGDDSDKTPVMLYTPDEDLIMSDSTYVPTPSFSRTAFREESEA